MIGSCLLTKPSGRAEDLGGGVEVYFGHFQSLRLGWQPFLNVDATQRAFMMSGKVHHILADSLQMRRNGPDLPPNFFDRVNDHEFRDFSRKIATLKVMTIFIIFIDGFSISTIMQPNISLGNLFSRQLHSQCGLQWTQRAGQ